MRAFESPGLSGLGTSRPSPGDAPVRFQSPGVEFTVCAKRVPMFRREVFHAALWKAPRSQKLGDAADDMRQSVACARQL